MSDQYTNEPMLDMFLFETSQLIEQLEQSILNSEKSSCYTKEAINEIFRIMHTIKGSSAMMMFNNISTLAHSIEDLFFYLREDHPQIVDYCVLSDLILESVDFIKAEMEKIKNGDNTDGNASELVDKLKGFLLILKQSNTAESSPKDMEQTGIKKHQDHAGQEKCGVAVHSYRNTYKAVIRFEEGCEMENIRAYTILHNLKGITEEIRYIPQDIIDSDESVEIIRRDGFKLFLKADQPYHEMFEFLNQTIFLKELELVQLNNDEEVDQIFGTSKDNQEKPTVESAPDNPERDGKVFTAAQQSIISVSVAKLDKLMDLVGEMVISEAMVIQNPDLKGMELENFSKAARQLHKISGDIQDTVMSIRMVPLSATFLKMHRIVRDMCKKLEKEVQLKIIGEETEVDKNVIEHISDPLMHLVRNALDHGIELPEERLGKGKTETGTITLEAKNSGSDVLIIIRDNGKGLDREKILKKARGSGLLYKPEDDMSDREIYNLIFYPGFSTKDEVTEFSGRGVGMDVVIKNIETIGGSVSVDSILGEGSVFTLKIPLTLAIIDGMNIRVGSSYYTIPTINIRESFRPSKNDVFSDTDGNEMIMVRGQCYAIVRLHELFKADTHITGFSDGIIVMIEQDDRTVCIFVDELLGQQQVVVKALPEYIRRFKRTKGLAGCTLLGDGSISLILDVAGLTGLR